MVSSSFWMPIATAASATPGATAGAGVDAGFAAGTTGADGVDVGSGGGTDTNETFTTQINHVAQSDIRTRYTNAILMLLPPFPKVQGELSVIIIN